MLIIIEGIIVILAAFLLVFLACKGKDCLDRFNGDLK
jgi:hypothetical protein